MDIATLFAALEAETDRAGRLRLPGVVNWTPGVAIPGLDALPDGVHRLEDAAWQFTIEAGQLLRAVRSDMGSYLSPETVHPLAGPNVPAAADPAPASPTAAPETPAASPAPLGDPAAADPAPPSPTAAPETPAANPAPPADPAAADPAPPSPTAAPETPAANPAPPADPAA